MRQGLRASAPARADRATEYRTRNQAFGGEPFWAVSPYIPNGPDNRTQNAVGNIHNANGAQTGAGNAQTSMALSVLGDTYTGNIVLFNGTISGSGTTRTLTVHSVTSGGNNIGPGMAVIYPELSATDGPAIITALGTGAGGTGTYTLSVGSAGYANSTTQNMRAQSKILCYSGAPSVSKVTVNGKGRWRFRIEYNDRNAAGQSGRKALIRNGDTGSELSNGLGTLNQIGSTQLCMFSFEVPAATKAIVGNMGNTLIWQMKNSSGEPVVSLSFTAGTPNGGTTPPGIVANPDILLRCAPGPWRAQIRVLNNYPTATPLHWIMRVRTGIAQWVTGKYYGPNEYIHNAGNVYKRQSGGSNDQISGATAPTGTGTGISDGTCTWDWVMATPATNAEPRVEVWLSVGTAAWVKVADMTGVTSRTNIYPDVAVGGNTQYGWYANNAYDAQWSPGDFMEFDWSEMTIARQEIAVLDPSAYVLDQWFSQLRDRF